MAKMTRAQFEDRAIREEEKRLGIPAGWWGTYRKISGPRGEEVNFTGRCWAVRLDHRLISRHDSRAFAIRKAQRLFSTKR